ncbi:MAG: hypothetical protein JNK76_11695 [Planctomycetales bacterium]|nr:hypothetical protein [Planctomycetales bacterium]MBN8624873.1 hypothetical protein [Planctomycetota bacterium]
MSRRRLSVWSYLALAMLVALPLGCNKSSDPAAAPSAAAASTDAPEAAVKGMIDAATAGDATVAWNILTAKQQADVKAVVQELAGKVDPEVWQRGFGIVDRLAQIAKTKKDYILGSSVLPQMKPEEKEELARNWQHLVDVLEALATTDIKTVDGLKNTDPGKFLATTGTKVLTGVEKVIEGASPTVSADWKSMKTAKVSLVSREGDTATIKIETEGTPPKEAKVKRVDGKWQPLDMVDAWDGGIAGAKKGLAGAAMTPEQKQQALAGIAVFEGMLDKIIAANDQKAFDEAIAPLAAMAPMMLPSFGPPPAATGPTGLGVPAQTGPGSLPAPGTLPNPSGAITPPSPIGPSLPGTGTPGNPNVPAGAPSGVPASGGPTLPAASK